MFVRRIQTRRGGQMDNTSEPQASEWDDDRSDSPNDDPGAVVRFAGCSVATEIIAMEVGAS
jgi:hypothetical protein